MVHDDYKELIPAHALSALDAADKRVLNEHLAECAECRRDLAECEATAASLALSAKPMEPSPQVREKLLTQIRAENPGSAEGGSGTPGAASSAGESGSEKSTSERSASNVVPFSRQPRTLWNTLGSFGSIAAVILFAALLVSVILLWQQNRQLRHDREFIELLNAPGSRVAQLSGTNEAANANAKLAYDQTGRAFLIANGLPRAPEGKEYQLWYIVDNKPIPGKTFAPDTNGQSTSRESVPDVARKSAIVAITLEPAGGRQSPTGAIYLRGEL
jgi:anti-sigma-K factor RskA